MNWKIRLKNPIVRWNIVLVVFATIGTYFNIKGSDVTSWAIFGDILLQALSNPYLLFTIFIAIAGILIDPTTTGFQDSPLVMVKTKPTATPITKKPESNNFESGKNGLIYKNKDGKAVVSISKDGKVHADKINGTFITGATKVEPKKDDIFIIQQAENVPDEPVEVK